MRIDDIGDAEFMMKYFPALLRDADDKVLILIGPIRIAHPNLELAGARHFEILVNRGFCFHTGRGR